MEDDPQAEQTSLLGRHHRIQRRFDLHRVGLVGESEPDREATHVGVHGESGLVERHRPDHVRGLSPDPGKGDQVLQSMRDLTSVLVEQSTGHPLQALGLLPEEAGAVDDLLEFGGVGAGESHGIGPSAEDLGSRQVHPLVRALRGQDRGHQQLEGIAVVELAEVEGGTRIVVGEELVDDLRPAGGRPRPTSTVGWIGVRESGAGHGGDRTRR